MGIIFYFSLFYTTHNFIKAIKSNYIILRLHNNYYKYKMYSKNILRSHMIPLFMNKAMNNAFKLVPCN